MIQHKSIDGYWVGSTSATLVGNNQIYVTTQFKRVFKLSLHDAGHSEWSLDLPELNKERPALSSCAVGSKLFVLDAESNSFEVLDTRASVL